MNLFPKPSEPIIDGSGRVTRAWYNYLRLLTPSEIAQAIVGRVDANESAIKALQDAGIGAANVIGQASVETIGSLDSGLVIVRLMGDEVALGGSYVYGTDEDGIRGFYQMASQIGTSGSVEKTTDWSPYTYLGELDSEADLPAGAAVNDLYVIAGRAWVWNGTDWVGIGAPPGNVSIALVNDEESPGSTTYYGTGPGGAKGWFNVSDAIEAEAGQLTKAVGEDGVTTLGLAGVSDSGNGALLAIARDDLGRVTGTRAATITGTAGEIDVADGDAVAGLPTISLADVSDVGGGELRKFDRDAKGRVSGTSAATTDDLGEGSANLYHTDERAQDAVGSIADDTGDVQLVYETSPARRLWARLSTAISDLINSAMQPGDNVSELDNDAGYVDAAGAGAAAPVQSVNGETGTVVLSAVDLGAATAAQGALADSATQPGDPVSTLDNDAGYLTTAVRSIVAGANITVDNTDPDNPIVNAIGGGGGSVDSVNGQTGVVVLDAGDVGADVSGSSASAQAAAETYADGKVANTIVDGVTDVAPSQKAVFDALAKKYDKTGGTIGGSSSGQDPVRVEGSGINYVGVDIVNLDATASNISRMRFVTQSKIMGFLAGGPSSLAESGFVVYDYTANDFVMYANLAGVRPGADNARSLGSAPLRWSTVYAGTGAINTSDAREKSDPRDMTPQEIACGIEIARLPCIFQWLASIEEKGEESARLHCGPTVQSVIATMESRGLDPFRYSFVCYDAWPEQQEIVQSWDEDLDEDGSVTREAGSEVVQEHRVAGDRYSLRPSGLEAFCRRAMMADRDALEARLSALEGGRPDAETG